MGHALGHLHRDGGRRPILKFASTDAAVIRVGHRPRRRHRLSRTSPRRRRRPPATDFSWGAPDPFTLTVDPGATADSGVQSESDGAGVIAISASIVPASQGVTVSLDSASAATDAIVPVHVSASVGAAPGIYTATLTGTLNGHTHSVNIPVTVGAINGIPLLYEAVPIKPDGPDAGTEEDITDVPGDATKVYIAGLLKGDAGHRLHGRPANRDELPERLPRQHGSHHRPAADVGRHTDVRRDRVIRGRRAGQRWASSSATSRHRSPDPDRPG